MYYPKIKVIFPHVAKTGGSTLEYFLGQLEHPEIFEKYKDVKRKMSFLNVLYKKYQLEPEDRRWVIHRVARHYFHKLGMEEYDSCYSFSIVRNPFAQIKSLYTMDHEDAIKRGKDHVSWEEYIFNDNKPSMVGQQGFLDQDNLLTKNKQVVVNELFPFEYFQDVVRMLGRKLGFKPDFGVRLWATKPKYEYTPDMIERVMDHFSESYDLWKKVKTHWEKTGRPYAGRAKSRGSNTG